MGQEIDSEEFSQADYAAFEARLRQETELLGAYFRDGRLDGSSPIGGFELEAWLIGPDCEPAPVNQAVLAALDPDRFTSELALFNLEINNPAAPLTGDYLDGMHRSLAASWAAGGRAAAEQGARLCMIGILPTLRQRHLHVGAMTPSKRYAAINRQILKQRGGAPLRIDIVGDERLRTLHSDVMLESANTSFQIHTQVAPAQAVRYYNAAILVSAPMVAACANSPLLFGKQLWAETRIPLFEQSVAVGGIDAAGPGPLHRVGFGSGYARRSLHECFVENLEHFPALLPTVMDAAPERLAHLRLHNGTVWRWNRPLIGFEQGPPHLRIEHRALPGGPSVVDVVANAALYYGLAQYHSTLQPPPESQLQFATARDNFYLAARHGLQARIAWMGRQHVQVQRLLLDELIPCARQGLLDLGFKPAQFNHYLDLVADRVDSGRTGADWQRRSLAAHGGDCRAVVEAYLAQQDSGQPVHLWPL